MENINNELKFKHILLIVAAQLLKFIKSLTKFIK